MMSDHNGLRYLFDQPIMNARQARWLAMLSVFDFKIRYIKGKENRVADSLNLRVKVNCIAAMSSNGTYLQEKILQDDRY